MNSTSSRRIDGWLLLTLLIVLAYVAWLLSLPAWPSQDGPMHLYYTNILGQLLSHQPTAYARFYFIKHLLPPYALYYYALLALSRCVPLLVADRLILCAYVVSFVLGFRYFARAIGPAYAQTTLLVTLLLLNWPLGMGFTNFCLSLSFVFWALGLWLRSSIHPSLARRVAFVLLAVLVMFTHPVPLLVLLGAAFLELVLRGWRALRSTRRMPSAYFPDVVTLCLASLTLVYVKLFTTSHPLTQTLVTTEPGGFAHRVFRSVIGYGSEKGLAFFLGPGLAPRLYRVVLLIVLLASLALAIAQYLRNRAQRRWASSDTLLVLAVFAIVVMPLIPHDLNGSHFFADRLLLFVWLLSLLAASGYAFRRSSGPVLIAVFVLCAQAMILHTANAKVRPAADLMAAVDRASGPIASAPGQLGLVLEDARPPEIPAGLSYDPLIGVSFDVMRHDNAVLANTPWLDLAIIPLGATPALPASRLAPDVLEFPSLLRQQLADNPELRKSLLSQVDFVAIDQSFRPPATGLDPLLTLDPETAAAWRCGPSAVNWLRVCRRLSPPGSPSPDGGS